MSEEQEDGTVREFWVNHGAGLMHTVEFAEGFWKDSETIFLSWWTDSIGVTKWDSHNMLAITKEDARRMIATLQRLIDA
ncbi:PRC-barrel domain-containing protein [Streptomyces noursei]|uniref:PRC-barrel domain-containing protein n=1 Tax=Streptomyces TaxID=1883 RepID=UPI00167C6FFC|nr:PRC-barrel domain-containing protein [Streptomyces mashuensis]